MKTLISMYQQTHPSLGKTRFRSNYLRVNQIWQKMYLLVIGAGSIKPQWLVPTNYDLPKKIRALSSD